MTRISTRQSLRRRLLGYYLMFGLIIIVALSVGWTLSLRSALRSEDDQFRMTRIAEVRSLILDDLVRNEGLGAQALIQLVGGERWVTFAGMIGNDGKYVAHSKPTHIGRMADAAQFESSRDPVIQRNIMWDEGAESCEYWAPISHDSQKFGWLQVGTVSVTEASWFTRLVDWMPITVFFPIAVLSLGAVVLKKTTHANAVIDEQLCAVLGSSQDAAGAELRLKPLADLTPTAIGWNRLIARAAGSRPMANLDAKLSQSITGLHEKRFERLLNGMTDGVVLTDHNACIVYANRSFGVLIRQPDTATLHGRAIHELLPASSTPVGNLGQESCAAAYELHFGATLGEGVLRVARIPLQSEGSASASQHLWTVRDITQQKMSDEVRTQFVYSATHELRTPLANIKAYAETLAINEIADPEKQKGFLNIINSEATRLGRFVEELLNVSQMEAGSLSLSVSQVELERLLPEVAETVRSQMLEKQITFDVQFPPKMPSVRIDKDKFVAALVNLLGNAAKYTPNQGRVTFRVTVGESSIQFSVEDTGFGISPDELPKLFTKFFRSHDIRVRDIPGSGLGLSFANEVARLHGGKLNVHSELNMGSQFILTLPIG